MIMIMMIMIIIIIIIVIILIITLLPYITTEKVYNQCRKIPNWKAPGPNGIHGFWLKKLPAYHQTIAEKLEKIHNGEEDSPGWMTSGRTVLCIKDSKKGNAADNFRPISCLPVMWN